MELFDPAVTADLIALRPSSYAIRGVVAVAAFFAAMDVEKVISRVIGLVILLLTGGGLLLVGITHGTVVDIVLGAAGLAAAGYTWWFTRG